jgi:hypothetical protein
MPTATPGQVQNCPTPSVTDCASPSAMASARSPSAPGSTNTGLTLPISAYTGIGSGRVAPASNRARPAVRLPVKATALVNGCRTSATAMSLRVLCSSEKTPAGIPVCSTARMIARAVSSEVAGCAGCALTTTGHPAASADAVSVPATEKANGKLLALKTATGPIGINIRRMSGRGGRCSGFARSIRASTHDPSRTSAANSRNCRTVRARSPVSRSVTGSAVSAWAAARSSLPSASISIATCSSSAARCSAGAAR